MTFRELNSDVAPYTALLLESLLISLFEGLLGGFSFAHLEDSSFDRLSLCRKSLFLSDVGEISMPLEKWGRKMHFSFRSQAPFRVIRMSQDALERNVLSQIAAFERQRNIFKIQFGRKIVTSFNQRWKRLSHLKFTWHQVTLFNLRISVFSNRKDTTTNHEL